MLRTARLQKGVAGGSGPLALPLCQADLPLKRAITGSFGPAPNAPFGAHEHDVAADDTIVEGMAGRYAAALFDIAKEAKKIPEVEADLGKFQSLLDMSEDLGRLVRSPVIAADDQAKAVAAVLEKAGIDGLAGNFFKLIAANRRLFAVSDMIKGYRALAAKNRGEIAAEVTSAVALNDAQVSELKDMLKASVGKAVTLNTRVDPSLLGGLVVKVGSRMVDSSLKTKLHNLKITLSGPGA